MVQLRPRKQFDPATGKYLAWDANGDGGGYIRKEGEQFVSPRWRVRVVSADLSAAPKQGHVRIYLDGASEPRWTCRSWIF